MNSKAIKIRLKRTEGELKKAHAETELLLSSITSILIGLGPKGLVRFWNGVAETTFGIGRDRVIDKPLERCDIQWDLQLVMTGIEECQRKGRPARIDDVRFLRFGQQEGFLGLTLIPVKGEASERLEMLIFGADITERRKLEQLKDNFVSTVSHELRTPLTVIREGVSQVLEGILGPTTEDQSRFLSISLQAIDRLTRIINDLLDISKIEAEKLELKRSLVDVAFLIQELASPLSPFYLRAKDKNLAMKSSVPRGKSEVYADKDKLIQVFTNLIGNAMKFTERGSIEISLHDKSDFVECRVSDTGRGITAEDLPKVFSKFQQFGRTSGPGEQGTGLGLAISKGLVEMHGGKMWVESKSGEGTTFFFTIPKLAAEEIFKDQTARSLKKAIEQEKALSILDFQFENFTMLEAELGPKKIGELMEDFERSITKSLRQKRDIVIRSPRMILVILPSTKKEDTSSVAQRLKQDYEKWLAKTGLEKRIRVGFISASFPEDGESVDELLRRVTEPVGGSHA